MAIKVIAQRREVKLGKKPGMKFVMRPDLYIPIAEKKVFSEASTHSGISAGVIKAAWDAAGEVIRTWATEGHSVPLPGLGTMRFGVRAKAVAELEDVKTNLISVRRIIFTPNVEVKDELKNTSIQITCLDEDGNVLKRVTSGDSGEIEDNEGENNENTQNGEGGSENQGSQNGNEGGNSQNQGTSFALSITKSGSGTSTVKNDSEETINSGDSLESGANVYIAVTPAEGQIPTATLNGSNVSLTENDGEYVGTFQMPAQASTLVINSGSDAEEGDQN
jgi:predicted histone-like DNA-binding protein